MKIFARTIQVEIPDVLELAGHVPLAVWILLAVAAYLALGAVTVRKAIKANSQWISDGMSDAPPPELGKVALLFLWPFRLVSLVLYYTILRPVGWVVGRLAAFDRPPRS